MSLNIRPLRQLSTQIGEVQLNKQATELEVGDQLSLSGKQTGKETELVAYFAVGIFV